MLRRRQIQRRLPERPTLHQRLLEARKTGSLTLFAGEVIPEEVTIPVKKTGGRRKKANV